MMDAHIHALLQAIGYWGQTASFAFCVEIRHAPPPEGEYLLPLQQHKGEGRLQPFFLGLATEFRDSLLSWEEVILSSTRRGNRTAQQAILLDTYIWPLVLLRQYDGNKLFQRQSLREAQG